MSWFNPLTWKPVDNLQGQNDPNNPNGNNYQKPAALGGGGYSPFLNSGPAPASYAANSLLAAPPSVLGANATANGTPSGTGAPADPYAGLRSSVANRISLIQHAYDALTGNIRNQVADQNNQNNQNYDKQLSSLGDQYQTTANGLGGAFSARGLGDSSFYGGAQQDAGKTYADNQQSILDSRNQTAAGLGQFAQSNIAQDEAAKNSYGDYLTNLPNYTQSDLQSLDGSLGQAYNTVQGQAAGIGTNQQFVDTLHKYAPTQNQGGSQLASQLQQLVSSGAPTFAKNQIQQGLIKQAGITDPSQVSYWADYFRKLQNGGA